MFTGSCRCGVELQTPPPVPASVLCLAFPTKVQDQRELDARETPREGWSIPLSHKSLMLGTSWVQVSFWGDESVLELNRGGGPTDL